MSVQRYDFRKPPRLAGDLEQRLTAWLRNSCALVSGQWAKQIPVRLGMSLRGVETSRPAEALARFTNATVGYRATVSTGDVDTLLVLPRPLVLALVTGALGDTTLELPADRELTAVEDAVCEYLIQRLLLSLLQETWPHTEPLNFHLGPKEPRPKWNRVFAPSENPVICTFVISGPFSNQEWHWLLPQKGLLEQLAQSGTTQAAAQVGDSRAQLQSLVSDLPVEVSVLLGAAELSLSQLAQLRPGDVVLLKQRVSEPLPAFVANEQRFRVWAGRAGSRQAVRIESLVES